MLNDTLLDITQKLAKVGGWAISYVEPKSAYLTPAVYEILEYDTDLRIMLDDAIQRVVPAHRDEVMNSIVNCRTHGEPCDLEVEIITPKDNRKWIHVIAQAEMDADSNVLRMIGAVQDITHQKTDEFANRRLSERLLNTLENMSDAFYLLDRDWRMIYINRAADRLMGQERIQGFGRVLWNIFPYLMDTPLYSGFMQAVRTNTPFHYEYYSNLMKNWIELDAYPSQEGLAVYFHSITERKQMQERLDQAQHMESIGKLTGHVAHDFNNLLTIILGNAELLEQLYPLDDQGRRLAANIRSAALKGSDLTRRLLAYARKQTLAPRAIDINRLVESMRELLSRTLGVNINIALLIQPRLPPALIDDHQLEGALLNLSLNARDAMPRGGDLTISTNSVQIDATEAGRYTDFRAGEYIRIRVSDSGTGISPEHLKHVFEPFFTTKEQGKGTGLGLSSVFGFAKQSNGHVTIASTVGVGTMVDLYLPVSTTPVREVDEKPEMPRGGNETILVVDDDELVRSAAHALLTQRLGYQVLAVSNGDTAMSVLKTNTGIQLLFSDVMMPGMNGHELARQARRLRPDLRILLTSGFVSPTLAKSSSDTEFPLLSKPYSQQQLARALRDILDRPR